MRNRDSQVGRAVKLCRKPKPAPPDFIELLKEAKIDGASFAPNYLELCSFNCRREHAHMRDKWRQHSEGNFGVYCAAMSMFHYSLSRTILANEKDEDPYLIRQGLNASILAQNRLISAFIWLPEADRKVILHSWQYLRLSRQSFTGFYQGVMATARLAYACILLGVKTRVASIENDLHYKIDLFCDNPMIVSCPTLCLQIKSNSKQPGAKFEALRTAPNPNTGVIGDYQLRQEVWEGVGKFNRKYNRNWLPIIARVGVTPDHPERLRCDQVITDTCIFLNTLISNVLPSASAQDAKDVTHSACA